MRMLTSLGAIPAPPWPSHTARKQNHAHRSHQCDGTGVTQKSIDCMALLIPSSKTVRAKPIFNLMETE